MDTKRWPTKLLFYGTVTFGFAAALVGVASRLDLFGFDMSVELATILVATFILLCVILRVIEKRQ